MTQMKQAFDFCQRIFFDLFRQVAVLKPQLAGDDHRDHIAGAGQVSGADLSLRIDNGGVGRPGAQIEDRQRARGAGSGERPENGRFRLSATHLNRNLQFVLNFTGDQGHLQAIRLDHRGDTHRLLQRELSRKTAGHADWHRRINGQQILNADLLSWLIGKLRHGLAHVLKHAADIGARFSRDVVQFAAAVNRFHDGFRPGGHINLYAAPLSDEQQITCRNSAGLDVAGGGFHHHGRAVANQRPCHWHDIFGLLGVEIENGRNTVGVGERFDDLTG